MNNNLENSENNNTVPNKIPDVLPANEPIVIPDDNQLVQPNTNQEVEQTVSSNDFSFEQPIIMPEIQEQPTVISVANPEVVPVVTQNNIPVQQPTATSEFTEPVIMPVVSPVVEPVVIPYIPPIDEPVFPSLENTVVDNNNNEEKNNKSSKKGLKILIFALILLVIGFIIALVYYVYSTNEKVIINNSIKQLENFKNYFESPIVLNESEQYSEKGNFTIQMDNTENTDLNQLISLVNKMTFNYNFSKTVDKTLFELNLSNKTEELGGVKLLTNSKTGYIFLNKIFDKYIEIEELKDALSSTNYNDLNDYDYLYNFIVKSFVNNVNKDDFVRDKTEIKIDGTTKKVNSLKLEYNDKQISKIVNLVINDIKSDDKANKIVTNFYKDFESYNMDDVIDSIDEEHMSTYIYTVYTNNLTNVVEGIDFDYKYYEPTYDYSNCFNFENYDNTDDTDLENMSSTNEQFEVKQIDDQTPEDYTIYDYSSDDSIDNSTDDDYYYTTDDNTQFDDTAEDYTTTNDYSNCAEASYEEKTISIEYRNDTKPRIYFNEDDELQGFVELEKVDQTLTVNVYKSEDEKLGYIKINSTKTLYEITADFTIDNQEYKVKLSTNIKEVTAGAEYDLNRIFSYEAYDGKNKEYSLSINMDSKLKTSASIEETITDSVKYDELTEEQMQEIYTNIMNIISKQTGQY